MWKKYGRTRHATDDNIIRRMRIACWKIKATDTHSEYVVLIAFPQQEWLRESSSILPLYIHCLVYNREGGRLLRGASWMLYNIQFVLRVWPQLNLYGICGGPCGTGRGCPPSIAVSPCQYHRSILIFICVLLYQQKNVWSLITFYNENIPENLVELDRK